MAVTVAWLGERSRDTTCAAGEFSDQLRQSTVIISSSTCIELMEADSCLVTGMLFFPRLRALNISADCSVCDTMELTGGFAGDITGGRDICVCGDV